jgi:hypothetical protein
MAGGRCIGGRGVQNCERITPESIFAGLLRRSSAVVERIAGTGCAKSVGFVVEGGLEATVEAVIEATVRLERVGKAVRLESVCGEAVRCSRRRWVLLWFL